MPVQLVRLDPREPVLFRDSRPFDAGQHVSARSQLPEPGTLFGAARTAALQQVCADLPAYGGGRRCGACRARPDCPAVGLAGPPGSSGAPDHAGAIRCLGTFLADRADPGRLFVPCPGLLVGVDDGLALRAPRAWAGCWNAGVAEAAVHGPPSRAGRLPQWIRVDDLAALLTGRLPQLDLPGWAYEGPAALEPRVGLARRNGVAMDGYLYRAEFRRYHPGVGPAAAVSVPSDAAWAPTVYLGGRGRTADLSVTSLTWPPIQQSAAAPGRYAVAIVTPAWFAAGWHPCLPEGVTVASAAVATQEPSQGWDLVRRRPRPMLWVCPAGSVWWLDAATQEAADQLVAWHGRPLCEDRPHAGYGLAFVGRWEHADGSP